MSKEKENKKVKPDDSILKVVKGFIDYFESVGTNEEEEIEG